MSQKLLSQSRAASSILSALNPSQSKKYNLRITDIENSHQACQGMLNHQDPGRRNKNETEWKI